jgi:hypothetical protein
MYNNGAECLNVREKAFRMKIEVISRPYAASDGLVQSIVQNSRER